MAIIVAGPAMRGPDEGADPRARGVEVERFEGRIEAGSWLLVPRVGGEMRPCPGPGGRWEGIMTVGGDIAQAMSRVTIGSPLRLRTDSGSCLDIVVTRWWPVGSSAMVEFAGLAERVPRPDVMGETA